MKLWLTALDPAVNCQKTLNHYHIHISKKFCIILVLALKPNVSHLKICIVAIVDLVSNILYFLVTGNPLTA